MICIYIYIILKIETIRNNKTKALKQLENIETKAYCSLTVLDLNRITSHITRRAKFAILRSDHFKYFLSEMLTVAIIA